MDVSVSLKCTDFLIKNRGFVFFSAAETGKDLNIPSVYLGGLNLCSIETPLFLGANSSYEPAAFVRLNANPRYTLLYQGNLKRKMGSDDR